MYSKHCMRVSYQYYLPSGLLSPQQVKPGFDFILGLRKWHYLLTEWIFALGQLTDGHNYLAHSSTVTSAPGLNFCLSSEGSLKAPGPPACLGSSLQSLQILLTPCLWVTLIKERISASYLPNPETSSHGSAMTTSSGRLVDLVMSFILAPTLQLINPTLTSERKGQ